MLDSVKASCRNSLTIAWARLQVVVGVLCGALVAASEIAQTTNAQQILPPAYIPVALVIMGVITETARRRKEWQK